jgi:hypothetical protein
MRAARDFGALLQHVINAYVYGDVWSRALPYPECYWTISRR